MGCPLREYKYVLFTDEETKLHIQVGMTEQVVAFGKFWSQKILLKFTSF